MTVLDLIAWGLIGLFASSVVSTYYLWRVYLGSPLLARPVGRPRLFRDWAVVSLLVTIATGLAMYPAVAVVLDYDRVRGAIYYVVAAVILASVVPIYLAQRVYRLRRAAARQARKWPPTSPDPPGQV